MSWISGQPELYQPVASPDVEAWPLVRRCDDRLQYMCEFLAERGISPQKSSYLDVAACYGWFVGRMRDLGFHAEGIELDPRAKELAWELYGLEEGRLHIGEAVSSLGGLERKFTVVTCFSLLHHFVLGRSQFTPERLLQELDRATAQVLIVDMGQATEAWFRSSMPEWTVDYIEDWLMQNSTFVGVTRLGVDGDSRPPFEGNYGRTVFALSR